MSLFYYIFYKNSRLKQVFFLENMIVYKDSFSLQSISECGVTANIPGLGPGDSGFESRHSDKIQKSPNSR